MSRPRRATMPVRVMIRRSVNTFCVVSQPTSGREPADDQDQADHHHDQVQAVPVEPSEPSPAASRPRRACPEHAQSQYIDFHAERVFEVDALTLRQVRGVSRGLLPSRERSAQVDHVARGDHRPSAPSTTRRPSGSTSTATPTSGSWAGRIPRTVRSQRRAGGAVYLATKRRRPQRPPFVERAQHRREQRQAVALLGTGPPRPTGRRRAGFRTARRHVADPDPTTASGPVRGRRAPGDDPRRRLCSAALRTSLGHLRLEAGGRTVRRRPRAR